MASVRQARRAGREKDEATLAECGVAAGDAIRCQLDTVAPPSAGEMPMMIPPHPMYWIPPPRGSPGGARMGPSMMGSQTPRMGHPMLAPQASFGPLPPARPYVR